MLATGSADFWSATAGALWPRHSSWLRDVMWMGLVDIIHDSELPGRGDKSV